MNLFMPLEQDAAEISNNPPDLIFFPNLLGWILGPACDGYSELSERQTTACVFAETSSPRREHLRRLAASPSAAAVGTTGA